jgi:carboxylate-amine ligase
VRHCLSIVGSGTSADTQLAVFEQAQGRSEDRADAFRAVTDWIAEATLQ